MKKIDKWMKKVTCATLAGTMMIGMMPAVDTKAATAADKKKFEQELITMLETADASVHNVRSYNLTWSDYTAIRDDVLHNKAKLAYECYAQQTTQSKKDGNYLAQVWLYHGDEDFPERYAKAKQVIENVKSQITPDMSDVDKLILIHDYIVDNTVYRYDTERFCYTAGAPLTMGFGVCSGYAKAMDILLNEVGIETKSVHGSSHQWSLVKLDGEWYHVDPTWDDTRSAKKGKAGHTFLLRTDSEFKNANTNAHIGFDDQGADSTEYSDWYVHDIVGNMEYYDGYWYYEKEGSICKNDTEGNDYELVLAGTNMELVNVEDGLITYKEDGITYQSWIVSDNFGCAPVLPPDTSVSAPIATNTPVPTATSTPVPTATSTPKPTATNTPVPTATNTPVPTATNTPVPTATNTPVPTATSTPKPTATNTPVPTATNTPVPTATNTPVPTATSTPKPTATNTPVPTATNTPKPTATSTPKPTATNTPVPTATNTPMPTATSTPKPTATSIPAEIQDGIPEKYTQVKCVEILSDDWKTSYFVTGVNLQKDYDIECVFEFTSETSRGSVFGYSNNNGTHVYLYRCLTNAIRVGYSYRFKTIGCNYAGGIYTFRKKGNDIYLNGTRVFEGDDVEFEKASDIRLGVTKCKLYSTKIWDGSGKLIRDYVPALDENGAIGLYDRANDNFVYYTTNQITYHQ